MNRILELGIDVGSTTVKLAAVDPSTGQRVYERYKRHGARQRETLKEMLQELEMELPDSQYTAAVCGSGGKHIAAGLHVHYIQEVVANSAAVKARYPKARTAIELGGQDAKVVFFYLDQETGQLQTSDMRMNGSCAGGTGAFIDEIAALLNVKPEEFNALAEQGIAEYEISGRCGVFAKTDIQPLLLAGAKRQDIARSAYAAIVKQTIGGLAQGLKLEAPIIFEGGPLTFHPELIRVFAEKLHLTEEDIIIPEHPETIVAYGTAIAIPQLFSSEDDQCAPLTIQEMERRLERMSSQAGDEKELEKIAVRHPLYQKALRPKDMYQGVSDIIPETLSCGEGWLMAAEIDHYAREGVRSFIILQPFGCLPNHVCGRGVIKSLKEKYPGISILPLDLDPDTSYANVENRLQMLLMTNAAS